MGYIFDEMCVCVYVYVSSRKQDQYRFCWYLPLAGLKLCWVADQERSSDAQLRLDAIRTKMYLLRQQLEQQAVRLCERYRRRSVTNPFKKRMKSIKMCLCVKKGSRGMILAARSRKKLEQMELMLLIHSPVYRLELHSPSGKVHTQTHILTFSVLLIIASKI